MKTLGQSELAFFRSNGYIILRGLLDPALMAQARESIWTDPPPGVRRDDPASWVGPFQAESDAQDSNFRGFTWKYRRQGAEQWMIDLLPKNPSVWAIAEQLLGAGMVEEPTRVRGVYCMMPEGDLPAHPYYCHVDQHAFHLGTVAYVDDVDEDGGGFNVWPGSHIPFYRTFQSAYGNEQSPEHKRVRARINDEPRVDCWGKAGDVVFWHHRLGHSAGHNRTARIRQAVLYDFKRTDLGEKALDAPYENMWQDWPGLTS